MKKKEQTNDNAQHETEATANSTRS